MSKIKCFVSICFQPGEETNMYVHTHSEMSQKNSSIHIKDVHQPMKHTDIHYRDRIMAVNVLNGCRPACLSSSIFLSNVNFMGTFGNGILASW